MNTAALQGCKQQRITTINFVMIQRHGVSVEERENLCSIQHTGRRNNANAAFFILREYKIVIFELCTVFHRADKSRMPAYAHRHLFPVLVFDREFRSETIGENRVAYMESKIEGIDFPGLFIIFQQQIDIIGPEGCNLHQGI